MALTQEQINSWVEKQIQLEIAAIPGPAGSVTLEPTLDSQIETKRAQIEALYKDHSKMSRAEYAAAVAPLNSELQSLKTENAAIVARNNAKLTQAAPADTSADLAKVQAAKTTLIEELKPTVKADIAAISVKTAEKTA
jgi:hypothetical protein